MNIILFAKALHVVGFISWFAGLFFLGRLLVNHAETDRVAAAGLPDSALRAQILREEYTGMENRVYRIIANPAMMITWTGGLLMVVLNPAYFVSGTTGWLTVKLSLVVLLVVYHVYTKAKIMLPMQAGERPLSAWKLRLWNEVPTFFLVSIVFTVTFGKVGELSYLYLGIGVLLFCLLVYRGAVAYRDRQRGAELLEK
ncbi:putative membrane protein [Lewinella aquimaris]|uniref:Protoporphyrinogen IX oxidase n=1 Tax=Neolewinella aquimaris TaxID=1835722 RepID=A0A840E5J8_9BACT|nr:CopD family protein [Neolewinella aquimaris]MBB4079233.1 putative membrane protein [Neolewinella aquimaris]